jgi:hypothetical protein
MKMEKAGHVETVHMYQSSQNQISEYRNHLTSELNRSAQRWLPSFLTGDFNF